MPPGIRYSEPCREGRHNILTGLPAYPSLPVPTDHYPGQLVVTLPANLVCPHPRPSLDDHE